MSVILTMICHASTSAARDVAFPSDEPLDAQGRSKAANLAATIRRVDAAWTSPALRAVETAAALRLNAATHAALRDIDYGAWSGRTLQDVSLADPAGMAAWLSDSTAAPHGGESIADLLRRVSPWMDAVGEQDGRVVVVTHAAVARAVIILALGAPPLSFWRIDMAPLARVRLRGRAGRWSLLLSG